MILCRLASRRGAAAWIVALAAMVPLAGAQPTPPSALVHRLLPADTTLDGVPCARSTKAPAEFHVNKTLAGCALSRDYQVGAHQFTRETWLDFNPQGLLWGAWLAHDTQLGGHLCRGNGYKAWSVRFHPGGALAGCYLAADAVVAGVPCMRGTFLRELRDRGRTALQLYANGSFRRCVAARDTVLNGRPVKKWQVVERDSVAAG